MPHAVGHILRPPPRQLFMTLAGGEDCEDKNKSFGRMAELKLKRASSVATENPVTEAGERYIGKGETSRAE